MRALWRTSRIVLALLLVLAVVVTGFGTIVTLRALPTTDGDLRVPGLEASVTVHRDEAGIARIYADTPHDLFMAQGYVHAQDRMWQMEVWRHISAGRLSELFGAATLETDRFVRALGWRRAAERDLQALSPEARAAIDAYAAGINAWLDANRGSLGMPFVVTGLRTGTGGLGGYEPQPWTALDSAAWQKVQAWNLGGNLDAEIFRMLADTRLGDPARTDALFPSYREDAPVVTPADRLVAVSGAAPVRDAEGSTSRRLGPDEAAGWRAVAAAGSSVAALAGLSGDDGLAGDGGIGSNNWVVAPSRSASGGAMLANDPHLGIGMPSVWYMNGLHCREVSDACPYDVAGVSFPGTPAVVLGHNARIAWGATNVDPDVQDLFVETPDPADARRYLSGDSSLPFVVREERIKVAGAEDEVLTVRETEHGPVLNDVDERLASSPPVALRWTALAQVDGTFEAIFRLNTAADFDDFRDALSRYGSPSQHFVYADVEGHIGYQLPGRIPIRAGATGERPVPAGDSSGEWTGYVPFDDLPWQLDPPGGLIVTANNAPVDAAYPHHLGGDWDPGDRAARILELLDVASADGITADEMREIQLDTVPLRAARLQDAVTALQPQPETTDGQALLDLVAGWRGACSTDDRGCAAYHAFEYRLLGHVFADELGPLARDYAGGSASFETAIGLFERPDDPWWDDARTDGQTEQAVDIVARALDGTAAELHTALGRPESWTWGAIHRATFREETLGTSGIGPLEWYLNRGPVAAEGAPGAVLNTYHRPSRGYADPLDPDFEPVGLDRVFDVAVLPSYRLTIDMADLDGARIVQTTGQSGNPFDTHYGDLIDDWGRGQSIALTWSRDRVERDAAATLTLRP